MIIDYPWRLKSGRHLVVILAERSSVRLLLLLPLAFHIRRPHGRPSGRGHEKEHGKRRNQLQDKRDSSKA